VNSRIIQVQLTGFESHQDAHFVSRKVFHLVNLVLQYKPLWPLLHARELFILHENRRIKSAPGMLVEVSANHLAVLRPVRESDRGAVNADKAFSIVVNERQKRSSLLLVHFQFAAGIEEHGVKIIQILGVVLQFFLRQHFGVRSDGRSPQSRLPTQSLDGSDGVGNSFVPIAFFFSED
jgi:hypothetical protein